MKNTAPTAFSYLRFSSSEQAKGDSLRRQTELRDAWIKKSGAVLDTSVTLRDEGVSGFTGNHRINPDRHALAAFLELVKAGRIPRGSFLVVESLDRLSREHIRPALTLLLNLIEAGIRIVQLLPVEAVYDESVEAMQLLVAIMELSRGHSESRMKSERVGRAWQEKKKQAAANGLMMTKRLPAWLRVEGGKIVPDAAKAATVRYIFKLARDGYGIGLIVKRLAAESVPTIGPGKFWATSYVAKILSNRAVVGECQVYTGRLGKRKPEGPPIAGYFPSIITEDEWHATKAAMTSRKQTGGRPSRYRVNLFSNLLHDARNGGSIVIQDKGKKGAGPRLASYRKMMRVKGAVDSPFPMEAFETAILSQLRELNPRDVLPAGDDAVTQVLALTGKLGDVEKRLENVKAALIDGGEVGSLVDVVRALEAKRAALTEQLTVAKRQAASPLADAWGECRSLVDLISRATNKEEARMRLRSAIRRIVEGIWAVFTAKGATRIAGVRVQFAGGKHRDYIIVHKPKLGGSAGKWAKDAENGKRPAKTAVKSFAETGSDNDFDLRKKADAKQLATVLESIDLTAI